MRTEKPSNLPFRGRPAHPPPVGDDNRSTIIFLTVCAEHRQRILDTPVMHDRLLTAWRASTHWLVGRYLVMPDHVHLFCAPNSYPATPLASWIAYWKRQTAFTRGTRLWQKNFWDVQLRQHESYTAKWEYVRNNPARARLAASPNEWPYQGELNILRWHH